MTTIRLTDEEVEVITSALRVGIEVYLQDAKTCEDTPRVAEQFRQQAAKAQLLLTRIEGAA